VLQNVLYLLGFSRQEICLEDTHILNWKAVKELIDDTLFEKLLAYSHRGQKPEYVHMYAKVNRLLAKVEKFELEQVFAYNLYFGMLLRWLRMNCALRSQDIEIRRESAVNRTALREQIIEENERNREEKEHAREEKTNEIPQEELEEFSWEEWENQYNEEHPFKDVPEEVQPEFDEDCELP